MTGIEAFLEILAAAGVRHIFGNPGTTELPLNAALAQDERFQYIFGLHEIPIVAAADGFAQATGNLGVANVHICCGLGNAMGMLYNAHCAGTPLLLTAGQQDRRLQLEEPVLSGDMVSVTRPWTKWSYEIQRAEDIPQALRRAIQTALTPPTGPVFLALPIDVQLETFQPHDLSPPTIPDRQVRPSREALQRAAAVLAEAKNPAILSGSRITEAGAIQKLVAVAEHLGAPVIPESHTAHGRLPFPTDHPLLGDNLPLWSPQVHERLAPFDVLLVIGMDLLRQYIYHEPACPLPKHLRIIQIDNDPWQLGKNYPVELALIGDPKATLQELDELLAQKMPAERKTAVRQRIETYRSQRKEEYTSLQKAMDEQKDARPMTPLCFMASVARALPENCAVVQEAITTTGNLLEKFAAVKDPAAYFAHRGWALGWGLGCALGVKLAWPDRPVLALLGEGSALYGIQGLWTAAHYRMPITYVICNNAQYRILKDCVGELPLSCLNPEAIPGINLTEPEVDFVALARSFGVEAQRINEPDELIECLQTSLAGDRPRLIDVPLNRGSML